MTSAEIRGLHKNDANNARMEKLLKHSSGQEGVCISEEQSLRISGLFKIVLKAASCNIVFTCRQAFAGNLIR